jgi:hypothetical protein
MNKPEGSLAPIIGDIRALSIYKRRIQQVIDLWKKVFLVS